MVPLRFYISSTFTCFAAAFLLISSITITVAFAADNEVHRCIPKSAASSLNCTGWSNDVESYCGSTRNEHVFWASSSSAIAAVANSALDTLEIQVVGDMLGKIDYVAKEARRTRASLFIEGNCTNFWRKSKWRWLYMSSNHYKWARGAYASATRSGLSLAPSNCFTQFKSEVDSTLSDELFATMDGFMKVLLKTAEVLHEKTLRGNTYFDQLVRCWPKLYYARDGTTSVYPFNCRVMTVAGIRRDGTFAIPISFTNAAHNDSTPENMRLNVGEQWSLDGTGKKIRAHDQLAYRRRDKSSIIENTTTLFSAWGGSTVVSNFLLIPTSDGPAMRHVLRKSEKIIRNVLDSIATSNVAILVLPATFALVPISVIEYLSRSSLCITIVFTDILPVLPLAIKGVELLTSGRKSHTGCVANTVGTENSADELAAVELWCARCAMDPKVFYYGVAFFSVAVIFIVTGIAVELCTYRSLRRRIKHIEDSREDAAWWQRTALRQYQRRRHSTCSTFCHFCQRTSAASTDKWWT